MQTYESQLNGDLNWALVKGTHVLGLPCQLESNLDSRNVPPQFGVLELQRRLLQVWLILLLSILKPIFEYARVVSRSMEGRPTGTQGRILVTVL